MRPQQHLRTLHQSRNLSPNRDRQIQRTPPRPLSQCSFVFETLGKSHDLLEAIDAGDPAIPVFTDDHVKTVGAEVDGSQNLGVGIRPVIRRTVIRWFVNNSVVDNSGPEEFQ